MSSFSNYRGHKIICISGQWIFSDTGQPVSENKGRKCGKCELENTKEGHDPCLGTLPGVLNACCGHGNAGESYIVFENGFRISGFLLSGFTYE